VDDDGNNIENPEHIPHVKTHLAFFPALLLNAPLQLTLLALSHFRFNALWLPAHLDPVRTAQISRRRTKLGGCSLAANYVNYSALAV
jgi:hypothetical protein